MKNPMKRPPTTVPFSSQNEMPKLAREGEQILQMDRRRFRRVVKRSLPAGREVRILRRYFSYWLNRWTAWVRRREERNTAEYSAEFSPRNYLQAVQDRALKEMAGFFLLAFRHHGRTLKHPPHLAGGWPRGLREVHRYSSVRNAVDVLAAIGDWWVEEAKTRGYYANAGQAAAFRKCARIARSLDWNCGGEGALRRANAISALVDWRIGCLRQDSRRIKPAAKKSTSRKSRR